MTRWGHSAPGAIEAGSGRHAGLVLASGNQYHQRVTCNHWPDGTRYRLTAGTTAVLRSSQTMSALVQNHHDWIRTQLAEDHEFRIACLQTAMDESQTMEELLLALRVIVESLEKRPG